MYRRGCSNVVWKQWHGNFGSENIVEMQFLQIMGFMSVD